MIEKKKYYDQEAFESETSIKNNFTHKQKKLSRLSKKHDKEKKNQEWKSYGGIKSRPIKYLKHPLERPIGVLLVLTLFFTILAIVTGIPIVIFLFILILSSIVIKRILTCQFQALRSNETSITPIESYWLCKQVQTNIFGLNTCLLFMDKELSIDQLRNVIMTRVIQRPEMSRFRSILYYKGKLILFNFYTFFVSHFLKHDLQFRVIMILTVRF